MKKILLIMLLVFLTACAQETDQVAYDFTLEDHYGNEIALSDYSGNTVYMFIWTSI